MKTIFLKTIKYLSTTIYLLMFLGILMIINDRIIPKVNAVSNNIIINEFVYDPINADLNYEWIELYNLGNEDINLKNWKIQIAGTSFVAAFTFQDITIRAHEYFTVCEKMVQGCNYYVDKIAMQNGGDATDGVQITDPKGLVIDSVLYDKPNKNSLKNESSNIVADDSTALKTASGESLGRKNLIDTDNNNNDFYIFTKPTPKQENPLDDSLDNTGTNVVLISSIIIIFIILLSSATLLRINYNFIFKPNGQSQNK